MTDLGGGFGAVKDFEAIADLEVLLEESQR